MSGTYNFAWNGDYGVQTTACDGGGSPVSGTNNGMPIGTSYGEGGSVGVRIDDVDEYLTWPDSGDQYIDDDVAQTIWMRVYISANVDSNTTLFEAWYDSNSYIKIHIESDGALVGSYRCSTGVQTVYRYSVTTGSWSTIGYSWDAVRPDGDHSATADAGASWGDNADEIDGNLTNNADDVTIGENASGGADPGTGKYIDVDKIAIVNGYKASCPW